jgi:hypothetical protein
MGTATGLAVANSGSNTVSIRLGDGLADLAAQRKSVEQFSDSGRVAIGLQWRRQAGFGCRRPALQIVSIRLGDGMGGFRLTEIGGQLAYSYFSSDRRFQWDGKQDFAVSNAGPANPGTVSIRLEMGWADLAARRRSPPAILLLRSYGDFNGDSKQDLLLPTDTEP